jgi:carbon monoxide dehydrogenase subunit G
MMIQFIFQTKSKVSVVFDHLVDPEKFVSIHPLIYKMEKIGDNQYKVFERVQMMFFNYSFTYTAQIFSNEAQNEIRILATVQKFTKIDMRFLLEESASGTTITEHLNIQSPLPIKGYLTKLFQSQHKLLFEQIDAKAGEHGND